jgi:hypothetical protein
METTTIQVDKNAQLTLPMPKECALIRRLNDDTVRVDLLSERDLLALVSERKQLELPDNVVQFARQHGIVEYVEEAMKAVKDVFANADRIIASLKQDEYGDSYIDINAVVQDDPEAEAQKYSACVERWAMFIPPDAGDMIHFSTSWAR